MENYPGKENPMNVRKRQQVDRFFVSPDLFDTRKLALYRKYEK